MIITHLLIYYALIGARHVHDEGESSKNFSNITHILGLGGTFFLPNS